MDFPYFEPEICSTTGKVCYGWRHAKFEIERVRREGNVAKGFHLEIYFCQHCKRFHIGSRLNFKKIRIKSNSKVNSDFDDYD